MTTTPQQAIDTIHKIWSEQPEVFEWYSAPILQGAHNKKLRIEIYYTLYGVKPKKITPYECMRFVEAKFRQLTLF